MSFPTTSPSVTNRRWKWLAAASLGAATVFAITAAPAAAQSDPAQKTYAFDLPAQSLSRSLAQLSQTTGLQLIYTVSEADRATAPALEGRMTADQALARLIGGSGFTYRYLRPGVITLERVSAEGNADGELVTGVVSVEGFTGGSPYFGGAGQAAGVNGINGSRDITATEGTDSFTSGALTIGSKVPQAMKDVPQSLSVLTSERMEQQNVTDYNSALKQLPGISFTQAGTNLQTAFYSRGFAIDTFQIDGGAPLSGSYNFFPQIDMSTYDHIELLRGAAGQFGGYGRPGGIVNLVRKKPLDHAQFALDAQAGSWSNYRVVADASSPLAFGGKLRGRLVLTWQKNRHFYDIAEDGKTLIYGIAEFDATPTTLVSAGISYTNQDSVPWQYGLPRYQNGDDLGLPRSTALAFPWNYWNFDTTEIFGAVEQKIGSEWVLKLNLTHNDQSSASKLGYVQGTVNPTTLAGPELSADFTEYGSKQFSAEATLAGAFEIFGQRQEVTVGVSRRKTDGSGLVSYDPLISPVPYRPYQPYPGGPVYCSGAGCPPGSIASNPPVDVLDFDPRDPLYNEPPGSLVVYRYPFFGQTQSAAYVNLRLTAFDRLHLTTGLRWGRYESEYTVEYICTILEYCDGLEIGEVTGTSVSFYSDTEVSWPPPVSLSYDVTRALTAYVGYTDIYESQGQYLGHDRKPVAPVTGSNWEAGLKWAPSDGRLNLSLAAYSIKRKGFATIDPPDYSEYENLGNGISCCYVANPEQVNISRGIEVEATGELAPGWQIAASYTHSVTKLEGTYYGQGQGRPFLTIQPKHLYKLWTSYDFGAAGHAGALSGLTLSGGVNGQSSGFYSGSVCTTDYYVPFPELPSYKECDTPPEPFAFTVEPYMVFSARLDYRFSGTWSLAVNLENIFDKTYYASVGSSPESGNWYGSPRAVTATLRAKW